MRGVGAEMSGEPPVPQDQADVAARFVYSRKWMDIAYSFLRVKEGDDANLIEEWHRQQVGEPPTPCHGVPHSLTT